jgi:hypothetical protein
MMKLLSRSSGGEFLEESAGLIPLRRRDVERSRQRTGVARQADPVPNPRVTKTEPHVAVEGRKRWHSWVAMSQLHTRRKSDGKEEGTCAHRRTPGSFNSASLLVPISQLAAYDGEPWYHQPGAHAALYCLTEVHSRYLHQVQ